MEHATLWGQFGAAAVLIIFAGVKLTKYGDILAERLKLGHAFVGAVLIGWSTSLPELVLSIGTAVYKDVPNVTMGNVLGSNLFNIFILVLLDIYYIKGPILRQAGKSVKTSAILSLVIVLAVGTFLCLPSLGGFQKGPFALGYNAVSIFVIYMLCMAVLYFLDKRDSTQEELKYQEVSLLGVFIKCALVVSVIVASGLWLSHLSTEFERTYSFNQSFIGSFFLAIVSSLPEVITCFIAVRMGFHSMAIGTLFGSNIFNMGILAFCEIFYTKGYILEKGLDRGIDAQMHMSSVLFILLMSLVTIYVLRYERKKGGRFIGFESIIIALLYGAALFFSYTQPEFMKSLWAMVIR